MTTQCLYVIAIAAYALANEPGSVEYSHGISAIIGYYCWLMLASPLKLLTCPVTHLEASPSSPSRQKSGPIAGTARDAALAYAVMCAPDPRNFYAQLYGEPGLPPLHLKDFTNSNLKGVRFQVAPR